MNSGGYGGRDGENEMENLESTVVVMLMMVVIGV